MVRMPRKKACQTFKLKSGGVSKQCIIGENIVGESEMQTKIYESVLQSIQSAINYCFLLNGAATVSILTFIGNYKSEHIVVQKLSSSILFLTVGVFLAALSSIVLYMAQLSYFKQHVGENNPFVLTGTSLRIVLLFLILASVLLFGVGAISASRSLF